MPDGGSGLLKLKAGWTFVWPGKATLVIGEGWLEFRWKDWVNSLGQTLYLFADKIFHHTNGWPFEVKAPTGNPGVRG